MISKFIISRQIFTEVTSTKLRGDLSSGRHADTCWQ